MILVVEDEKAIRELLVLLIDDEINLNAIGAINGLQALDLLETNSFDLITFDMSMPIMDGPTFLNNLSKVAPSMPVIVVSATPETLKPNKQVKASIAKPFDIELLIKVIQKVIT